MNIELTRRTLCMASWAYTLNATCLCAFRWFGSFARAATPEFPPDRQAIEAWMDTWMKIDRESVGALHVGRFADPIYFLLKPITWKPNPGQGAFQAVSVPDGFVTDFASIPRIFWSALRPDGRYTYPAIVHDFLYWTQTRPKEVADKIFKFGMEDFGVGTVTSTAIYNAVYWFGSNAWEENARLRARGEKRIVKRFPVDPTTTWEGWKRQPDVFK